MRKYLSAFLGSAVVQLCSAAMPVAVHGATTFVSNLEEESTGSGAVASDSWIAQSFITGTHGPGYQIGSVQVLLEQGAGTPTAFSLSIYDASDSGIFPSPGAPLAVLEGPDQPVAGVSSYSATSLILSRGLFFLVAMAESPSATGAFSWSATTSEPSTALDTWGVGAFYYKSAGDDNWQIAREHQFQFTINATPVPEPSALALLGVAGLWFAGRAVRRR